MPRLRSLLIALLVMCAGASVRAIDPGCGGLTATFHPFLSEARACICGPDLEHLSVTLRKPLKLAAACQLDWGDTTHPIDLRAERVSLDHYTARGNYPRGALFLLGDLTLVGRVRFTAVTGVGTFEFSADGGTLREAEIAAGAEMKSLRLFDYSKELRTALEAQGLGDQECVDADASIQLSNVMVILGDTDEAGSIPIQYTVRRMGKFQRCAQR